MAVIFGTLGNDLGSKTLRGGAGSDAIFALGGNDLVYGGGGGDYVYTGLGFDTVFGGGGDDQVFLESWQGLLDGEGGNDTLDLSRAAGGGAFVDLAAGTARIGSGPAFTARNFENLTGGAASDTLHGTDGRNVFDGGAGHDIVHGRGGDDLFHAGAGNDRYDGGAGTDTLSFAGGKAVTLDLRAGTATTGAGDADTLLNIERFVGSSAGDRFIGGDQAADFLGGAGSDSFLSGKGANLIDGGAGEDWLSYETSTSGVAVNLATGLATGGTAAGDRLSGVENLFGSNGADQLTGNGAENTLYGLAGSDELSGGGGADVLIGGPGKDFLTGGAGADIFYFSAEDADARDVVHDFQRGSDDIYLAMDADADRAGSDSFIRITHHAAPETNAGFTAGTINVRFEGQKTFVELNTDDDLVNGRDVAEYAIELSGRVDLQLSDFIL